LILETRNNGSYTICFIVNLNVNFNFFFIKDSEKKEIKQSREIWSTTRDASKALFPIQRINCIEKYLLMGLAQSDKNDYLGAFHYVS